MVVRLPPYVARPFRFAQPSAQLAERTTQNGLLDTRPLGCWDGVDEEGGLPSTHPTSAMLSSVFHTHDDITRLTSGEPHRRQTANATCLEGRVERAALDGKSKRLGDRGSVQVVGHRSSIPKTLAFP